MERTHQEEEQLVQNASAYMRMKLTANRHKPHWLTESENQLVEELADEWEELSAALLIYQLSPTAKQLEEVKREAADVHNQLEMLCAKLAYLRCHPEQSDAQTA